MPKSPKRSKESCQAVSCKNRLIMERPVEMNDDDLSESDSIRRDSFSIFKVPSKMMQILIRFYQKIISPLKGKQTCRFYPTCSSYAINAYKKHGFISGTILSVWRVLRCNPFNPGGYDPVPLKFGFHKRRKNR